jgi:hypothetical protein
MIDSTPKWIRRATIVRAELSALTFHAGYEGFDLDRIEESLVREFQFRKRVSKIGFHKELPTVRSWLKNSCYEIILACLAEDEGQELFERIDTHGRRNRGTPKADPNVFELGLSGLFAQNPKIMSSKERGRLAAAMLHGFRHYIPPPLLDGFNMQYPAHRESDPNTRKHIEPALREWVIEQHTLAVERDDPLEPSRHQYLGDIAQLGTDVGNDDEDWPD